MGALKYSKTHPMILLVQKQLREYFAGQRIYFSVPLVIAGTIFQKKAWEQLLSIPYGETISYGEQAKRLGDLKKARAVGAANGKNPISIIIPCHRVIGKNGNLTGFGGGLKNKQYLIELEAHSRAASVKDCVAKFEASVFGQSDRYTESSTIHLEGRFP
jgi:methylated-DNA-[protein]-cysteine S-methyltransferase